jgi:hypothetical protein
MDELMRNGSGYVDFTAYTALKNIEKEKKAMFKRGEIFEYEMKDRGDVKMALVVSADFRANDRFINIIILNENPVGEVTVPIICRGQMYADCGMVSFAHTDRMLDFVRKATDEEMAQIDAGIMECLGLERKKLPEAKIPEFKEIALMPEPKVETYSEELAMAKAEANIYKGLYEKLLEKVVG